MLETPSFPGFAGHHGDRATGPREGTFPRPPLAELGGDTRAFARDTEGCCVGAWQRNAAAGGRVPLGRAGAPRGILTL